VRAGTTDSIAASSRAGVSQPGEARHFGWVPPLMVLKLLSETRRRCRVNTASIRTVRPLLAGRRRFQRRRRRAPQHFSDESSSPFRAQSIGGPPTGLDYYPLPRQGERFFVNDPDLRPAWNQASAQPDRIRSGPAGTGLRTSKRRYRKLAELAHTAAIGQQRPARRP